MTSDIFLQVKNFSAGAQLFIPTIVKSKKENLIKLTYHLMHNCQYCNGISMGNLMPLCLRHCMQGFKKKQHLTSRSAKYKKVKRPAQVV